VVSVFCLIIFFTWAAAVELDGGGGGYNSSRTIAAKGGVGSRGFTLERLWKCLPVERLSAALLQRRVSLWLSSTTFVCVCMCVCVLERLGDAWHVNRQWREKSLRLIIIVIIIIITPEAGCTGAFCQGFIRPTRHDSGHVVVPRNSV